MRVGICLKETLLYTCLSAWINELFGSFWVLDHGACWIIGLLGSRYQMDYFDPLSHDFHITYPSFMPIPAITDRRYSIGISLYLEDRLF